MPVSTANIVAEMMAGTPADSEAKHAVNMFLVPKDGEVDFDHLLKFLRPRKETTCIATGVACGPQGISIGLDRSRMQPGGWGTCAVVGLGRNLAGHFYGAEIDGHDTVVRFGSAPVKGMEAHVGTRTTANFVREIRDRDDEDGRHHRGSDVWGETGEWHIPDVLYLFHGPYHGNVTTLGGKPYVHLRALSDQDDGAHLYNTLRDRIVPTTQLGQVHPDWFKPTEGMRVVLALLHSQLCKRVDLYGFSRDGKGHYFQGASDNGNLAGNAMVWKHCMALEYFAYRLAQANGLLSSAPRVGGIHHKWAPMPAVVVKPAKGLSGCVLNKW
eukprot:jgi/Mesvir1/21311/Mv15931-RA.1